MQAILPILREMGDSKGHIRQDALVTRLTLVAAAPWKVLSLRSAHTVTPCPQTPFTRLFQTKFHLQPSVLAPFAFLTWSLWLTAHATLAELRS